MTEDEWLTATDWRKMRTGAGKGRHSPRKVRLFSAACCRRIQHLFEDARTDAVLEQCEQYADGLITRRQLNKAEAAALKAIREAVDKFGPNALAWARDAPWRTARDDSIWEGAESCLRALAPDTRAELPAQTALFRDVFGNPFRRARVRAEWLTTDVVALARTMYESRDFSAMPILADALQDAGCDNEYVLAHCREFGGVHVRGCWVVDLVLGLK
jgi:hypothetical protein